MSEMKRSTRRPEVYSSPPPRYWRVAVRFYAVGPTKFRGEVSRQAAMRKRRRNGPERGAGGVRLVKRPGPAKLRDFDVATGCVPTRPVDPPRAETTSMEESLAQLVEHGTFNARVVGSSPTGLTRFVSNARFPRVSRGVWALVAAPCIGFPNPDVPKDVPISEP